MLLEPYGIRPLKDRGQHFLLDDAVVARMVGTAGIMKGTPVLEIGPGPGILTEALLGAGAEVVAVELDVKLRALLADRFGGALVLVDGDVLRFTNGDLASRFRDPARVEKEGYRVVANLPYGITSKLIERFLTDEPLPRSATVMVQKEVAERVTARPGAMSALAVFVQTLADVRITDRIPRGAFYPSPKVDSAVIHMQPRTDLGPEDFGGKGRDVYFATVRKGFSAPRKKLANTVGSFFASREACENAFDKAELALSARPAELGTAQWKALVAAMPGPVEK